MPEPPALTGDEPIDRVEDRREAGAAKDDAERTRESELGEERNGTAAVAGHSGAVLLYEPPALAPPLVRNRGQQELGLVVAERKQSELPPTVDPDDEPRRPAAEPSAARVQEDGTEQRHDVLHSTDYGTR